MRNKRSLRRSDRQINGLTADCRILSLSSLILLVQAPVWKWNCCGIVEPNKSEIMGVNRSVGQI